MNNNNNTDKHPRNGISRFIHTVGRVFRNEWRLVFSDMGVLLFFIALPLLYPITYTLIYNPEVVENMPVAVVDNCRSAESRDFVRRADAAPEIDIYAYCPNMADAKKLFAEEKVFGILEIPADYSKKIAGGEQATVQFYAEVSLMLRYRAFISALSDLQIELATDITSDRMQAAGASTIGTTGLPIENHNTFLGDPGQGFASFVMPGVVIIILQQSMVMGICLLGGTARERRRRNGGIDPLETEASPLASVLGKTLCYFIFFIPFTVYLIRFIPWMFSLPHLGAPADCIMFFTPFLIASALYGLTLQGFCFKRESTFLVIVFTSMIILFLSGLTWPRYAMNGFWIWLGNIIPATWGIDGFVRINSNDASLAEVSRPYISLWILSACYFVSAVAVAWAGRSRRQRNQETA